MSINCTSSINTKMFRGRGLGDGDNTEKICFSISTEVLKITTKYVFKFVSRLERSYDFKCAKKAISEYYRKNSREFLG